MLPRAFYPFIFAAFFSYTGAFTQIVAEGWLVAELTPEPIWAAVVGFCGGVPMLLFGIFGGAVADAMDRRRFLLTAQASLMVVAMLLGLLTKLEVIEVWMVAVLAFFTGVGTALSYPAYHGFLYDIVGKQAVSRAVSFNATQLHFSRMLGPALAGVLISWVGTWGCFTANALSFLAVMPMVAFVPVVSKQEVVALEWKTFLGNVKSAFRYVHGHLLIRTALGITAITTLFAIPHMNLLPLYVKEYMHLGAQSLGWLWSTSAAGSVVATIAFGRFSNFFESRSDRALVLASLLCAFSLAGLSFASGVLAVHVFVFLLGAFMAFVVVASQSIIQREVDGSYRGRVMGIWGTCFQGMFPIGNFLIGSLAQGITIPYAWLVASAFLLATLAILGSSLRGASYAAG